MGWMAGGASEDYFVVYIYLDLQSKSNMLLHMPYNSTIGCFNLMFVHKKRFGQLWQGKTGCVLYVKNRAPHT